MQYVDCCSSAAFTHEPSNTAGEQRLQSVSLLLGRDNGTRHLLHLGQVSRWMEGGRTLKCEDLCPRIVLYVARCRRRGVQQIDDVTLYVGWTRAANGLPADSADSAVKFCSAPVVRVVPPSQRVAPLTSKTHFCDSDGKHQL